MKTQNEEYSDDLLVKAAIFQIKSLFPILSSSGLIEVVDESKVKEQQRVTSLKKDLEDALKKKEKASSKKATSKESKSDITRDASQLSLKQEDLSLTE